MDLVGRKMTMKKGQVFADWLQEIISFVDTNSSHSQFVREFALMKRALTGVR